MPKVFNRGSAQSKEYYCVPYKSSSLKKHKNYMILDLQVQQQASEIGGWKNISLFKISVVAVYDSKKEKSMVFTEEELPALFELMYKRLVVGFGIKRLDLIVLAAHGLDLDKCKFFDMMVNIECQIWGPLLGLNSVIQGTLDKSMDFAPVDLWKEDEKEKLSNLSQEHVGLIHDVFKSGQESGFIQVKTEEESYQIPVQWKSLTANK